MSTTSSNDPSVGRPTVDDDALVEVVITFGYGYKTMPHPIVGVMDPDGWVKVRAKTYSEAMEIARRHFSIAYSMSYPLDRFVKSMHFYPLGELCVIDETTPLLTKADMVRFIGEAKDRKDGNEA